jgi:hypothetical protein
MGYEKLREEIFASQKRLGVIPATTQLTPWPDGQAEYGGAKLPRWDSLSLVQKKLYERQEVLAAYAAYTDHETGRIIQEVEDEGKLDNTLIIYICGDNGTSAEGTLSGTYNQLTAGHAEPVFDIIFQHVDDPPARLVADNANAFVEWVAAHFVRPLNVYTAYSDVSVKEIKAMVSAAAVSGAAELNPFLVILPIKSKLAFIEIKLLLRARPRGTQKDLDTVGTPHFAQFVPLEDNQIGFFKVHDSSFDTYIADFTKNICRSEYKL